MVSKKTNFSNLSYSGDSVEIIHDCTGSYFVKTFKDQEKGLNSIKKQQDFSELITKKWRLKVPEVYDIERLSYGLKVTMEYVDGLSGPSIEKKATKAFTENLRHAFSCMIMLNFEGSRFSTVKQETLFDKLNNIRLNSQHNEFDKMLNDVENLILQQSDYLIPIGFNHGDLTSSNLIVASSSIFYLVDFLPTFIESPAWDIVKIVQDLRYYWSARYLDDCQIMNFMVMANSLMPRKIFCLLEDSIKSLQILQLLCICRIIPYIQDKRTKDWVLFTLKDLLTCKYSL